MSRESEERELNSLEQHTTELSLPVFDTDPEPTITIQPRIGDTTYARRPVPVPAQDLVGFGESAFIPSHGMDFLAGTNLLHIQQTVELHDLLENVESENRYTIKKPSGETIYYASESSSAFQQSCMGSSRAFEMKIFDQTRQEALLLRRRLACGICSFWCYLQRVEVWSSPADFIGLVQQESTLGTPMFSVMNKHDAVLYCIQGPPSCMYFANGKDAHFKIFSPDGATQLGSINHRWDQVMVDYNLCLQFPGNIDVRHKALLLGAAFVLEYMYFERTRGTRCCRC